MPARAVARGKFREAREHPRRSLPGACTGVSTGPASVDFYVTTATGEAVCERLACRLAEKGYERGMRVFIAVAGSQSAARLDDLLWTFQQGGFVPHALAGATGDDSLHPVLIGTAQAPESHRDVLIVLRDDVPEEFRRFGRIIEVVSGDPEDRSRARARFRYYRDQGANPDTHEIDQ